MQNVSQFSLGNRKQLADLLSDKHDSLRSRTREKFFDKRRALREKLVIEQAEKAGAVRLKAQIIAAKEKLQELDDQLRHLGFYLQHDDDLDLTSMGSSTLGTLIDQRVTKELGTWGDIEARLDSVQIAMMTVPSFEEANKLLKSIQEI